MKRTVMSYRRYKTGVHPSFSVDPLLAAVLSGLRTISERTQQQEREGERAEEGRLGRHQRRRRRDCACLLFFSFSIQ